MIYCFSTFYTSYIYILSLNWFTLEIGVIKRGPLQANNIPTLKGIDFLVEESINTYFFQQLGVLENKEVPVYFLLPGRVA